MKYKPLDKVRIKSLDWYNKNKDIHGDIWFDNAVFGGGQSLCCGCELTIRLVTYDSYYVIENDYYWTDEMIECKVEEETKPESKFKVGDILFYRGETSGYLKVEEIREENGEIRYYETSRNLYLVENDPNVFADKVCSVETEKTKNNNDMEEKETLLGWIKESDNLRLVPHKDYEIKYDGDNFYLVKKKKEYPKTYEECCRVLGLNSEITDSELLFYYPLKCGDYTTIRLPEMEKFEKFIQLYLCRNAYWKIAGDEMGLDKPWEPDYTEESWEQGSPIKYVIYYTGTHITKEPKCTPSYILCFPSAEMRDAFYENFDPDIENCKELL